jgi:uncharacterized membrane protein YfcA
MVRSTALLFFAGLVASAVNAAAGGGTLLSFPALLGAGLSPLAANATSTVGLLTGYLASVAGYRQDMRKLRGEVGATVVPSILGGALGAWLLLKLGSAFFARIVPWLLIGSSIVLLLQPLAQKLSKSGGGTKSKPVIFTAVLAIALYAGYFGAGVGILFLGAMGLLYVGKDLGQVNAIKVFVAMLSNVIAAVTFVGLELVKPTGALVWRAALPLAVGALFGGGLGVTIARKLPPAALRGFAALVGLAIAVYIIFFKR